MLFSPLVFSSTNTPPLEHLVLDFKSAHICADTITPKFLNHEYWEVVDENVRCFAKKSKLKGLVSRVWEWKVIILLYSLYPYQSIFLGILEPILMHYFLFKLARRDSSFGCHSSIVEWQLYISTSQCLLADRSSRQITVSIAESWKNGSNRSVTNITLEFFIMGTNNTGSARYFYVSIDL
jgi:hypothetical protein